MIQGVHAQSVVFIGLESVEDLLQRGFWTGPNGYTTTSELNFIGVPHERLLVRIGAIRSAARMASCSFQLESSDERFKPKVKGTVEFTAVPKPGHAKVEPGSTKVTRARTQVVPSRTKLVLQGMADRDLVGTLAPTAAVREVANQYARQLLDEIASRLEELAKSESAGPAVGP